MSEPVKTPINIYTEANPNPNSLKFVVNFMLMPEGVSRDFPDIKSAKEAPLAIKLFEKAYERILSEFQIVMNLSLEETQKKLDKALKRNLESQVTKQEVKDTEKPEISSDQESTEDNL